MIKPVTVLCGLIAVSATLATGIPSAGAAPPAPTTANALELQLRALTQQLLDAVAPGDVAVWKGYLHDDFVHVDEAGVVQSKNEMLHDLSPLPAGLSGQLKLASFQVHHVGSVAIATHIDQEELNYYGQVLHTRFRSTDTWLRTPGGWRLLAEQTMALPKDPPVLTLTTEQLCAYNFTYAVTPEMSAQIECADGGLRITRAGRAAVKYVAEVLDVFFVPGAPRTRRIFVRNEHGELTGFVDRREGEDVRWTKQI